MSSLCIILTLSHCDNRTVGTICQTKCSDVHTAGTLYLLSLCDNCQWLCLVHRLNTYCLYNYCKYVLCMIIVHLGMPVIGTKGLRSLSFGYLTNMALADLLVFFGMHSSQRGTKPHLKKHSPT